jgi:hypothetical protein
MKNPFRDFKAQNPFYLKRDNSFPKNTEPFPEKYWRGKFVKPARLKVLRNCSGFISRN